MVAKNTRKFKELAASNQPVTILDLLALAAEDDDLDDGAFCALVEVVEAV